MTGFPHYLKLRSNPLPDSFYEKYARLWPQTPPARSPSPTLEGTENMPIHASLHTPNHPEPPPAEPNRETREAMNEGRVHEHGVAVVHGYEDLHRVLVRALDQAQQGKGKERHADGKPFAEQPMQQLITLYGQGFALGQAGKKMQESQRMERNAAVRELLGAIVYIAGGIIALESRQDSRPDDKSRWL